MISNSKLKFLAWNSQSIYPKKSEFSNFVDKHKPDVILLSETWLRPGISFELQGYQCYRNDRSISGENVHGGVAILI